MSFSRLVYYSAVIGGWAALAAWLVAENSFLHWSNGPLRTAVVFALVGAMIGGGLNLVWGASSGSWSNLLFRLVPGVLGGGLGGGLGAGLGDVLFEYLHWPLVLGWMILGMAIGSAEGLYERSLRKLRNGLLGGALGGLLGGWLFDLFSRSGAASSRAVAFVILGIAIGTLVGLAQVVLRDAWLTVLDGFRPGRQLILSGEATLLGRGDHLPLPFLGYSGKDLESEHAKIQRLPNGRFRIEDNRSRLGTVVNRQRITGPVLLTDGDVIRLGSNLVRFNSRGQAPTASAEFADTATGPAAGTMRTPPPPALPPRPPTATPASTVGSPAPPMGSPAPPMGSPAPRSPAPQMGKPPGDLRVAMSPPPPVATAASGAEMRVAPPPPPGAAAARPADMRVQVPPPPPPVPGNAPTAGPARPVPPAPPAVNPRIPPPPPPPPGPLR